MFVLEILNISTGKVFVKKYNYYNNAIKFIKKIRNSSKLKLLSYIDNSYLYD